MEAVLGAAAALVVGAAVALGYNRLVGARNRARYAWADCDALLVRRAQAVPRLAAIVQGAFDHERETLVAVAEARARVERTATPGGPTTDRLAAEEALGAAEARLLVVVEGYPELRAQAATDELVTALREIEADLRRARIVYNRTVQTYADRRGTFPGSLVAGAFRFAPMPYFGD
jgi:LemA protein